MDKNTLIGAAFAGSANSAVTLKFLEEINEKPARATGITGCEDGKTTRSDKADGRMTTMAVLSGMAFRSGRHAERMTRLADWLDCQDMPEDIEAILYELVQDSWW